jgi:hypothetical protein
VIDPASLLVDRRAKRAKTDRIDARAMVRALMAWARGEQQMLSEVRVLTVEQDNARRGLKDTAFREGSHPSKGNTRSKRDWGNGIGVSRDAGPDKSRAGDWLLRNMPSPR